MAWKSYALGLCNADMAAQSSAEIISEQLGECTADTSNDKLNYTYGGVTYTVQYKAGTGSGSYQAVLSLNDETGEFVVAVADGSYGGAYTNFFIIAAILRLELDTGVELYPMYGQGSNLSVTFNITGDHNGTELNTTNRLVLVPALTGPWYPNSTSLTKYMWRRIAGMYSSNTNNVVKAGQTIELAGQQFLCVACGLFAKL